MSKARRGAIKTTNMEIKIESGIGVLGDEDILMKNLFGLLQTSPIAMTLRSQFI
jgi:hypothetical protein